MTAIFLLPRSIVDAIIETEESWGTVGMKIEAGVAVGTTLSIAQHGVRPARGTWLDDHFTRYASTKGEAIWRRAKEGLSARGRPLAMQHRSLPLDQFRAELHGRWIRSPHFAVTVESGPGGPTVACWSITPAGALWVPHEVIDEDADLLAPLDDGWARETVASKHVCVVGVGSIGAAACESLTAYGVEKLTLVDPGRLIARNFARHRVLRRHHGRLKAEAVADLLRERNPRVAVEPLPLNADRNADELRPIVRESDIVLVCSDGTRSRRVTTHIAFWAKRPVVLACVQDFGAYGEILRLVPGRTGCLLCNRAELGGALEPEPLGAELDYDVPGESGIPMTAVTGDLWLIGGVAAKATVSTLLEATGDRSQRLAGDMAIIGLRPEPDRPPPFSEVSEAGATRWSPTAAPRPNCPTCGRTARR